jgi:hypothetical protein
MNVKNPLKWGSPTSSTISNWSRQNSPKLRLKEQNPGNWKNPPHRRISHGSFGIGPCNTIVILKEYVKEAIQDGRHDNTIEVPSSDARNSGQNMGLKPVCRCNKFHYCPSLRPSAA